MKPLLIHNENTSLLKKFYDNSWFSEKFSPSEKTDIDVQLNAFINNNIANNNISAIFIKSTLSTNYLEFLGLRLGIHIRLSNKLPDTQKLPIVFLCEETLDVLCRIYMYPEILYSKGIYITSEESSRVQTFFDLIVNNSLSGCDTVAPLLNRFNILPPANYLSHHSIANEWSILRWAKVLDIPEENVLLQELKSNIESLLYYKFLHSKYPIKSEPNKENFKIKGKGKILFIDDEWSKGWDVVLEKLISSSPDVVLETFIYDFKDKNPDVILMECNKKVQNSNPDVVLLDLRLSESDFAYNINSKELTGYKVLKGIKSINPGIQVLIFTASNKVWNFTELQNAGADGFIIKESPENSIDYDSTPKAIDNFISVLNNCFEKTFLKDFYIKLEVLRNKLIPRKNFKKSDFPLPKDFVDETLKWFELSCEVLKKETSQSMITASFIFLFSVLENLSNRIINVDEPIPTQGNNNQQLFMFEFRGSNQKLKRFQDDENNIGYYRRTNGHLKSPRNIPWKFKILNVLDFITDNKMKEDELSIIIKKRNDLIHANSTTGNKFIINSELLIALNSIIYKGLINVK